MIHLEQQFINLLIVFFLNKMGIYKDKSQKLQLTQTLRDNNVFLFHNQQFQVYEFQNTIELNITLLRDLQNMQVFISSLIFYPSFQITQVSTFQHFYLANSFRAFSSFSLIKIISIAIFTISSQLNCLQPIQTLMIYHVESQIKILDLRISQIYFCLICIYSYFFNGYRLNCIMKSYIKVFCLQQSKLEMLNYQRQFNGSPLYAINIIVQSLFVFIYYQPLLICLRSHKLLNVMYIFNILFLLECYKCETIVQCSNFIISKQQVFQLENQII
ncbi:unnamed protein product (macronuclear) [Paramecium tetraurelia]|uniref:Transmembrane protein n=1 Tax=Paramecium tetraurelia TaxID=5888 RepID=A0DQ52_PARTE|nr:uncharacterized protein GSPATT00002569001 [Paramecium tetraurelia]CAK85169.1 unnamed protein product [Paramecium tetraurelia]|eukprot:XP_001452566.1 hypothetical protein (macronuclear) [Paramecium tetraurelia strain d4-2]